MADGLVPARHISPPGTGWAVDVPTGLRVGRWVVTGPLATGNWGSVYAARRVDEGDARRERPLEQPTAQAGPAGDAAGDASGTTDTNGAAGTTGANGAVGTARDDDVAIKFLPASALTPGRRGMLAAIVDREVRFSSRANHPNIVHTFEIITLRSNDPHLDGAVCLVMERAAGSLADRWSTAARRPAPGSTASAADTTGAAAEATADTDADGTDSPDDAARESTHVVRRAEPRGILLGVAEALRNIHGSGWVHADLKPGNILIDTDGDARIADFGLSSELDGTHAYAPPRVGSWEHVPPEWWNERLAPSGTPVRTSQDIWAFGVIAHQVLTDGVHPFPGATASARAETVRAYGAGLVDLHLAPAIPTPWAELVRACLERDPERRPSAADVAERVRALPPPGPPISPDLLLSDPPMWKAPSWKDDEQRGDERKAPEHRDAVADPVRRRRRRTRAAAAVVLTCGMAAGGGLWAAGVIGSGSDRGSRPAVVGQVPAASHSLQVRVDRDCVVSACTLRQPVLFLTSGASPSGIVETLVTGPDGVDRNIAKPGAYNPLGRADRNGRKTGRWSYETGDPLGTWTVAIRDVQTGRRAVTTFQVLNT
ncbi:MULTISPECIES: protein kinase domain-containing protein [Protofrankia]|nr:MULTISPECIES: protein kinase [Protofrankia]